LVAIAALGLAGCGSSHSNTTSSGATTAKSPKVTHRSDLLTIMQADGELDDPQSQPSVTIGALKDFGATTVRTTINWFNFAPDPTSHTEPAGFDGSDPGDYAPSVWKILDGADRAASADDVTLYVTLNGLAPYWATGPGLQPGVNPEAWDPSPTKYEQWVKAVGLRYSGNYTPKGQSSPLPRIHFWSIWNEPNYGVNLAPVTTNDGKVATSAMYYRKLLEAGWNGLAATGHTTETDTILIGETAPRGIPQPTTPAGLMVPLRFIRAVYCVGTDYKPLRGAAATDIGCPTTSAETNAFAARNPALFKATGFAAHLYPDQFAPNVRSVPGAKTLPPGTDQYASFADLRALTTTVDGVAGAYGKHPKLPIYNTEFGYQVGARGAAPSLTGANAAKYLNQAEYLTWIDPRVRSFDQYEWHDSPPGQGNFVSGLYTWDSHPKPTLAAFQMPIWMPSTSRSKGTALQVWGCARAAPVVAKATHQAQSVDIQLSTDGGTTYNTVKTVKLDPATGGCYFDTTVKFPSSGDVRLSWANNGAPQYSRTQAITLN
jgi:hypothetical protein